MSIIITIDGPAGAGKSFVSREVARRLGYTYLDTGAMYRTAGLYMLKNKVSAEERKTIVEMLHKMKMEFCDDGRLLLNGHDVSARIRTPEIDKIASDVSQIPEVRQRLTALQRDIGHSGNTVAEGRDMGTVVFPDADYKFFLNASPEERAKRRMLQMAEKGEQGDYNAILEAIISRDHADSTRKTAPLRKAHDAMEIDSTTKTREEVVQTILNAVQSKSLSI